MTKLLLPGWSSDLMGLSNDELRERYGEYLSRMGFDGIEWQDRNGLVIRRLTFPTVAHLLADKEIRSVPPPPEGGWPADGPIPSGIYAPDEQADTLLDKPGDQPS